MAVPTYVELLQPTLDALHDLGGSAPIASIDSRVLESLNPPPDIVTQPHPGSRLTEIEYRLHWARTYLKHYGLIDNPKRGTWQLTDRGRATHQIDPKEVADFVHERMRQERKSQRVSGEMAEEIGEATAIVEPASDVEGQEPRSSGSTGGLPHSLTPNLPPHVNVGHFMRILEGVPYALYRSMVSDIWAQRGNPQEQTDWASPDAWIPERLAGDEQKLALRLWRESKGTVNPRHTRGAWYLATKHDLLRRNEIDNLEITARGRRFTAEPAGDVVAEIDAYEGLLFILRIVAEKGPGKRGDLLPDYSDYCRTMTTFRSESAIKSSMYDRLVNLIERGYVLRRSQTYEVTDAGLAYLETYGHLVPGRVAPDGRKSDILKLAKQMRDEAREQLAGYLSTMDPFKFEDLITLLLREMGYEDVRTTSPTNDKGVDVVAHIELGISSVREVIQVKRHKGSINRTVLDQLRGSLHRFSAVRGTVITTGRFTKGTAEAAFERGAAPITLIDGEKLLDLLMEHEIGVTKKPVEYYEFDPTKLAALEDVGDAEEPDTP